jgi:hypothetical protein
MKTWTRAIIASLLLLPAAIGCGGSKTPPTIKGKVTCKGTPLAGQSLVLFSETGPGEVFAQRFVIQEDGSFSGQVTAPGEYKVAIEEALAVQEGNRQPDKNQPTVPSKYRTRQDSGLVWKIEPGENERNFDLTN